MLVLQTPGAHVTGETLQTEGASSHNCEDWLVKHQVKCQLPAG